MKKSKFLKVVLFTWRVILAPWPFFVAVLIVTALAGGLLALVQIKATTALVNQLTHERATLRGGENWWQVISPYLFWFSILLGTMLVNWLVYMATFQQYIAILLDEKVRERFDRLFFGKALRLRLELYESKNYFDAMQRARKAMKDGAVANEFDHLQRLLAMSLACCGILVAFLTVNWLISLGLAVGAYLLIKWNVEREKQFIKINFEQTTLQRERNYWRKLMTRRTMAAEVRLFGLGDYLLKRWNELTAAILQQIGAERKKNIGQNVPITLTNALLNGFSFLILLLAIADRKISAGTFIALIFSTRQFLDYINMISWRVRRMQKFFTELYYVPEFLELAGEEPESGKPAPILNKDGIRFENVSFNYPGSAQASLQNINLHIRPGEKIALVGENGAGKSTLVKLLLGLYHPTSGRILVEGRDLQEIAPDEWRKQTAAVFQNFVRYSLTARENIGFGQVEKLDDQTALALASQRSGAQAVIEKLPEGYATVLGKEFQGGHELSGGQWQKLALARAYLRDAQLLALDEPASALDAKAELEVYRQFLDLSAGKTVLLISHRLGSARLADRIIFLQNGEIKEEGHHAELLRQNGTYAELYQMQAEWYSLTTPQEVGQK